MIRHRVFINKEKSELIKKLMTEHFIDFKKTNEKLEGLPFFYKNNEGYKITLDYESDHMSYSGKIPYKKIHSFRNAYENEIARKLSVIKDDSEFIFP